MISRILIARRRRLQSCIDGRRSFSSLVSFPVEKISPYVINTYSEWKSAAKDCFLSAELFFNNNFNHKNDDLEVRGEHKENEVKISTTDVRRKNAATRQKFQLLDDGEDDEGEVGNEFIFEVKFLQKQQKFKDLRKKHTTYLGPVKFYFWFPPYFSTKIFVYFFRVRKTMYSFR